MDILGIAADHNPWWRDPGARPAGALGRRHLEPTIVEKIVRPENRRGHIVLGPRQVGKTVLLLQVAEDLLSIDWPPFNITYFDFADDRLTGGVSPRDVAAIEPPGLRRDHPRAFLLDEITRASGWSDWLRQAIDAAKRAPEAGRHRFIATDSAATDLRLEGRETGQGRWDEHLLEPLTFREFIDLQGIDPAAALAVTPNAFELYLARSGFPEHLASDDYPETRRRLREDSVNRAILRDLLRTRVDVDQARALFVHLVRESGAIFNASARARDLGADPRSVQEWLRNLKDTMLLQELPPHRPRGIKAAESLGAKPKVHAADHGLVVAFAGLPDPLGDPEVRGKAFESAAFRHLREVARSLGAGLSHFRSKEDQEIDFILEAREGLLAFEVTSSAKLGGRLDRVRSAADRAGARQAWLLHGGIIEEERQGIRLLPLPRFLLDPWLAVEERKP
jgi:predicted AAA+ superfamily ATPase